MTVAPSIPYATRQPAGLDRLAQRLGLALVAWGERSVVIRDEPQFDAVQQRRVEQLFNDRALSTSSRPPRFF